MHELGIMTGVLEAACAEAQKAGSRAVLSIDLSVGEMTEAIDDALEFAFEALRELDEYALCAGAELHIRRVMPKSRCLECGRAFEHDRYTWACPGCGSEHAELIAGRELQIDSLEVDV